MNKIQARRMASDNGNLYSDTELKFVYNCIGKECIKGNFEVRIFLPNFFLRKKLIEDGYILTVYQHGNNLSLDHYIISWL